MEYDLETFLDEYQPLFKSEHHKQNYMTRLEQLKKRYFSDSTIMGSGFSKMKKSMVFRKKTNNHTKKVKENNNDEKYSVRETDCFKQKTDSAGGNRCTEEASDIVKDSSPRDSLESETIVDTSSEEVSLIVPPQQPNHHDKRSFAKNKAALFVRNRTKHFRKKNNAPKLISEEEEGSVNATKQSKTSEEISTPIQPPKNKNNTSSVMTSENNNGTSNLRTKELGLKQSRYLWKNARKRMNYVVGFIRKKDDDEVMLIEESERHEFTNYKLQVRTTMRRHSFSSVYETSSNIGDGDGDGDDENTETQTTMNQKYLSPQGIKIQNVRSESRLSSSRNSHRSSRRSSLDSSVGAMNSFISQMYLKKSQSNYSISSIGMGEAVDDSTTAAENKKEELFEECFFHSDTFQRDGNLACIENQLYDSVEENIGEQHTHTAELSKYGHGRKEFHISENDIRDIVNEEVNSYLDDSLSKTRRSPNRRQNNNNVKQSSAFSYSVNDLYDLFANKETSPKLKNIEVNFDGLVV